MLHFKLHPLLLLASAILLPFLTSMFSSLQLVARKILKKYLQPKPTEGGTV